MVNVKVKFKMKKKFMFISIIAGTILLAMPCSTFIVRPTQSSNTAGQSNTQYHVYHHHTQLGDLLGVQNMFQNKTLYHFRRVPYAMPPTDNMRFEKPKRYGSWKGTLNATQYGPSCMQYLYDNDKPLIPNWETSEDCLFLNIIASNDLNKVARRAVFIWIHGGGFTSGQGMMVDGSEFSATGDVVFVTINYRLNIFGFANVGREFPRNLGLWDQQLAMKWVKDNIIDYGGDPEKITIFGESAGGVSVGFQSIIPSNLGLFQRAIAQSGSCLSLRENGSFSEKLTRETGLISNCSNCKNETSSCIECLRNISAQSLLRAFVKGSKSVRNGFDMKLLVGPVVDGELVPHEPIDMLQDQSSAGLDMFKSIDFMTGTNDGEAGLFYFSLISQQSNFNFDIKQGIPSRVLCDNIAPYISKSIFKGCDLVSHAICNKYSPQGMNSTIEDETNSAINLYGDLVWSSSAERTLYFHYGSQKNSYQYLFTHKPTWGLTKDRPSWLTGANHADELAFIFGLKGWYPENITISRAEHELSAKMMSYWLNFGKTGNPNGYGAAQEWLQYQPYQMPSPFMILGEYRNATVDNFKGRLKFWNVDIPRIKTQCVKPLETTTTTGNLTLINSGFGKK